MIPQCYLNVPWNTPLILNTCIIDTRYRQDIDIPVINLRKNSVFVLVIFFLSKNMIMCQWRYLALVTFPFIYFNCISFTGMSIYYLKKSSKYLRIDYSGIFHSLQSVKILLLCKAKGNHYAVMYNIALTSHSVNEKKSLSERLKTST